MNFYEFIKLREAGMIPQMPQFNPQQQNPLQQPQMPQFNPNQQNLQQQNPNQQNPNQPFNPLQQPQKPVPHPLDRNKELAKANIKKAMELEKSKLTTPLPQKQEIEKLEKQLDNS